MTINKDYREWNVASQVNNPDSVFSYWKHMLAFRKANTDVLVYGSYEPIEESETGEMVLGYLRRCQYTGETIAVFLNFSDVQQTVIGDKYEEFESVAGNQELRRSKDGSIVLAPFGAVVLKHR